MQVFCSLECAEVEGYELSQAQFLTIEETARCVYCDELLDSAFTWLAVA